MKDRVRISGGNGRSSKLMCPSTYAPADFATFLTDLKAGNVYVDVTANNSTGADAGVTEVGTALNKANLLSDATANKLGYEATDDPTVNDAIDSIADRLDSFVASQTATLAANSWTTSTVGSDTLYSQSVAITGMTASKQYAIGINLANPAVGESKTNRDNAVAGFNDFIYDGWYECGTNIITFKTFIQPQYNFTVVIVGG